MSERLEIPAAVRSAYGFEHAMLTPIAIGWINRTFRVDAPHGRFVLQRLHPVFRGEVNLDIDAITRHLAAKGIVSPRVVPTRDGRLWVESDGAWRVLTFVDGQSADAIATPSRARSAARLAACFHRALSDLDHRFAFTRPGAHDTAAHLAKLERLLDRPAPSDAPDIASLARDVLAHGERLPSLVGLPERIIHGDLKATNILFDGDEAVALVDLDTLQHGTIAVELGDALRSWCNTTSESDPHATFDARVFEGAMIGYAEASQEELSPEEANSIVAGAETIALELASRFAADVYEDSYFGWEPRRFPTRRAHNLSRTHAQLGLARSIAAQRGELEAIVQRAFAG